MTKEELKQHCERQVEGCEKWAKYKGIAPSGKIYEEHKLILDLIKALEQQSSGVIGIVSPCKEQTTLAEKLRQLEHPTSDDCVSRAEVITIIQNHWWNCRDIDKLVNELPPVTPTHGTCKDCNLWCRDKAIDGACFCSSFHTYTGYDFYCADFEKRGNEND